MEKNCGGLHFNLLAYFMCLWNEKQVLLISVSAGGCLKPSETSTCHSQQLNVSYSGSTA